MILLFLTNPNLFCSFDRSLRPPEIRLESLHSSSLCPQVGSVVCLFCQYFFVFVQMPTLPLVPGYWSARCTALSGQTTCTGWPGSVGGTTLLDNRCSGRTKFFLPGSATCLVLLYLECGRGVPILLLCFSCSYFPTATPPGPGALPPPALCRPKYWRLWPAQTGLRVISALLSSLYCHLM